MTHGTRNATLAALWGAIVAGCIVNGCTYRTLEIQFRDVATKEPVEGVRVEASEIHIMKLFPAHAEGMTDASGTVKLALRSDVMVIVRARRFRDAVPSRIDFGPPSYDNSVIVKPWDASAMWVPQSWLQNRIEVKWSIR